jgi:hypothetical protein
LKDATWEEVDQLSNNGTNLKLDDKVHLDGGRLIDPSRIEAKRRGMSVVCARSIFGEKQSSLLGS